MTRVRLRVDLHHDGASFRRGELVDVPDATASRLLDLGLATRAPQPREQQQGARVSERIEVLE